MSEASPRKNPIPQVRPDDHEDVSWALSTAEATWNRGDRTDALKWLRRAAEAASEAEADDRALELAKVAAEIATNLEDSSKEPVGSASIPISMSTEVPAGSAPPVPSPFSKNTSPAFVPQRAPSKPGKPPPTPKVKEAQKPKAPASAQSSQNKAVPRAPASGPSAPRAPAKLILAPPSETSSPDAIGKAADSTDQLPRAAPSANTLTEADDTMFRARPAQADADIDESGPMTPRSKRNTQNPTATLDSSDDMEAWPTQSMSGAELPSFDGGSGEQTRIGTPAYREPPDPSVRQPIALRGIRTSQAVRVVVWRGPDGVHVAPHGTTVTAISVDAMLVALDPSADLSAWLANK